MGLPLFVLVVGAGGVCLCGGVAGGGVSVLMLVSVVLVALLVVLVLWSFVVFVFALMPLVVCAALAIHSRQRPAILI